jgi:hypothetical protein
LPVTGGQYFAHEPVHFDIVEVSGTNQYRVSPLLSTRMVPTLVWRVLTVPLPPVGVPDPCAPAGMCDGVAAGPFPYAPDAPPLCVVPPPELPHAAIRAAAPAAAGNDHHRLRIVSFSVSRPLEDVS